jgi:hypothetical protein
MPLFIPRPTALCAAAVAIPAAMVVARAMTAAAHLATDGRVGLAGAAAFAAVTGLRAALATALLTACVCSAVARGALRAAALSAAALSARCVAVPVGPAVYAGTACGRCVGISTTLA